MASMAGPQTRCTPEVLTVLLGLLPEAAKSRMRGAGLSEFHEFKIDGLGNRWMCGMLMKNSFVHGSSNRIEVRIREGQSFWITKEVVQHVLNMPIGSEKAFPSSDEDIKAANAEYQKVAVLLKYISSKGKKKGPRGNENQPAEQSEDDRNQHEQPAEPSNQDAQNQDPAGNEQQHAQQNVLHFPPAQKLTDIRALFTPKNIGLLIKHRDDPKVKEHITTDMLVRLYLGVAVERFLLPGSYFHVNNTAYQKVYNLDMLSNIDWSWLVFEGIMKGCGDFKEACSELEEGEEFPKNINMHGCVAVKLVVFVDCIKGNHLPVEQSGRMNLYAKKVFNKLLLSGNQKELSSFKLQKWEESLYGKFVETSDGNDAATVYQTYVVDKSRRKLVLDFGAYRVEQGIFVDCLDKKGHMHSNILHLVCYLWSADWKDKIILSAAAVESLLNQGTASAVLDKELTSDKVKDAAQMYAPIFSSGHCSLVVVSRTATKKYILDSMPGMHEKVANDLLTNLESYLRTEHNIDISGYANETPKVQRQRNNFDCGFHVLLYIRGFERSEIFDIDKEKVLMLRQELSQYLLFHTKNRKNPTLEPEPVIEETDDEEDDKEECMLIPNPDAAKSNTATMPNPDAPNPYAAKSPNPDAPATMPNPDAPNPDAAKSDAPATMPDPDAPNLDAAKSNTATKGSTEGSTEGTSDSSTEGSQQDSPVDENTGGIAGDQSTANVHRTSSNY